RRLAVAAVAHDLDPLLLAEQEAEALADEVVVVDNEDPDHVGAPGSETRSSVPRPGRLLMATEPPSSWIRSAISFRPRPCRGPAFRLSKPRPSSVTTSS